MNKLAQPKIYDLVIVGGGCSSLAFLLNSYRNNKFNQISGQNGICILEKGTGFGGGTLEENLIPSNTHTIGLLRFLMQEKEADMLPTHFEAWLKEGIEQKGYRPSFDSQKINSAILPVFNDLMDTSIYQYIRDRAELTSSLQLFGYFLRLTGNQFLRHAYENNLKLDFTPNSECLEIKEKDYNLKPEDQFYEISYQQGEDQQQIMSKKIVMATGGDQKYHPMYEFVPESQKMSSHYFLKQDGFLKALDLIEANPDKDISIIGGSHSAFSVIYMLLYGPSIYLENELDAPSIYSNKRLAKCPICNQVGLACKCFGDITPKEIHERIRKYKCNLKSKQIKLYHRHNFRLSYMSKELALSEGYTDFDDKCIHKHEGCVNSYTGLRGLTKKLYEEIRDKKIEEAEFIQFSELSQQQRDNISNSSIVIECLGYQSNLINFRQNDGNLREYTIEKDNFCKMDDNHKVLGFEDVYGTGLGFGIHTHDNLIGAERIQERLVRADSIQVYLSRLSQKILNSMVPPEKSQNP